jgi:hypothetical protein
MLLNQAFPLSFDAGRLPQLEDFVRANEAAEIALSRDPNNRMALNTKKLAADILGDAYQALAALPSSREVLLLQLTQPFGGTCL